MKPDRLKSFPLGTHAAARIAILGLLALLFSLAQTPAEVRTNSSIGSETGRASVVYTTGGGVSASQSKSGGYSYFPADGLAGHQLFSQNLYIELTPVAAHGTADLTHGVLGAYAVIDTNTTNIGIGIASTEMQFLDTVTFSNATGQPATITVNWKVEGSLNVTEGSFVTQHEPACHADYQTELRFDGPGLTAIFGGFGIQENDSSHDSTSTSATGWQTSSIQPFSQGYGGAAFSGTLTIPPGGLTVSVSAYVIADARGERPSSSDFANPTVLTFTLPQGVSFTSTDGLLNAGSRMVNIASRAEVRGGESVEVAGFIVTGSVPKKVIIRGIGPSLAEPPLNIAGALPDPVLELHRTDATGKDVTLFVNNNWKDNQQAEIQNTGIPPTKDLESAIVQTLDPGQYTAILRDNHNSQGIGVIEVYDLEPGVDSRLANISTRAFINAGDNVLIGGIIGGGNGSQPRVLIRAIGPSLAGFGVPDALQDPVLELHDKNGAVIATNDDWGSDQKTAIEATGLQPSNAKESAILATLQPTNYTAIVKGVNNTSGVGLMEVYHLQ